MKLEGKIIDFLGDSITEGAGLTDMNDRYDNVLKRKYNPKATFNHSIGGSRLAHQQKPSEKPRYDLCFCGRAFDLNPEADVIVVYGGVNDYIHGDAPIGSWGDETPATFYGGVYFLLNFLKTQYHAQIVMMTPARVCYKDIVGGQPSQRPMKQPDALPLAGYVEIIKKTAAFFNVPVVDLYDGLGIDPNIPEDKEKYTVDGLHFNALGHTKLAEKLGEVIEKI